jgi:hypothetical protein
MKPTAPLGDTFSAFADPLPWLIPVSLGEEVYPMDSKIIPAQLSPGVLYPRAKSKALSRIIILGALIAASVNVGGAQVR